MATARRRLDAELVRRGLAPSRTAAREQIDAGRVTVAGAVADKASRMVAAADPIRVAGDGPRFVSRGGEKLNAALDHFGLSVEGLAAIDCGSSTGGFTDCLLQRGARHVVALDVGTNQLHERLRSDQRVVVRERTNLRHIEAGEVGGPFPVVVADLSFISLLTVADALLELAAPGADLVVLVKPQFEAGRQIVSRGRGVVSDPEVWADVLERVGSGFAGRGAAIMGAMVSPLHGADGNVELLLWLRTPAADQAVPGATLDLDALRRVGLGARPKGVDG
jgi:23S rRNA (cytidine1920-2'-O)/16S rRNA (cytidine1409-2'-O)-methyltransferase